ncbi:MAG: hypothetical protein IKB23_01125 [Clostridia bacterium]|nr:hypothetical protein [Clostridia bacterium]
MKDTVERLVEAHCADFFRRDAAIRSGELSSRTLMELRYLNAKMLDAAVELVGYGDAELFISEIGSGCGYAHSDLTDISEVTYKRKKQELKRALAKKIHLID